MPDVLNRTTKEFLKSRNESEYPLATHIHSPNMSAVEGIEPRFRVIEGDNVRAMTAAEKDSNHLPAIQKEKMDAIDARTEALIDEGFEYPASSGNILSLSLEAQSNIKGAEHRKSTETYPMDWNTKDNMTKVALADAAGVTALFDAALIVKRGHLDSGTALKDQVRAATTVAAVEAITDAR